MSPAKGCEFNKVPQSIDLEFPVLKIGFCSIIASLWWTEPCDLAL